MGKADKPVWKMPLLSLAQEERRRAAAEARSKKLRGQLDTKRKVGGCAGVQAEVPQLLHCTILSLLHSRQHRIAFLLFLSLDSSHQCDLNTFLQLNRAQELDKFEKLAALPSIPEALADKYRFDGGSLPCILLTFLTFSISTASPVLPAVWRIHGGLGEPCLAGSVCLLPCSARAIDGRTCPALSLAC